MYNMFKQIFDIFKNIMPHANINEHRVHFDRIFPLRIKSTFGNMLIRVADLLTIVMNASILTLSCLVSNAFIQSSKV